MPQSLSNILVHVIFSTKNREPMLTPEIRESLHGYIAGVMENLSGKLLKAGSVEDHIHLLLVLPRTSSPADLVKELKIATNAWLKEQRRRWMDFHWQAGYGMFSISPAHKEGLIRYIENQEEHHRKVSFQEEYRRLLGKYGIEYDEKYVWD